MIQKYSECKCSQFSNIFSKYELLAIYKRYYEHYAIFLEDILNEVVEHALNITHSGGLFNQPFE